MIISPEKSSTRVKAAMAKVWFYQVDGTILGPVGRRVLQSYYHDGRIEAATLVWRKGMQQWLPAAETEELRAIQPQENLLKVPQPTTSRHRASVSSTFVATAGRSESSAAPPPSQSEPAILPEVAPPATDPAQLVKTPAQLALRRNIKRYRDLPAREWPPVGEESVSTPTQESMSQAPPVGVPSQKFRPVEVIVRIGTATGEHLWGLLTISTAARRRHKLRKAHAQAQLQLGIAIAQAGHGDQGLRDQLDQVEEKMLIVQQARGSTTDLELEHRELLLQLAYRTTGLSELPEVTTNWNLVQANLQRCQQHEIEVQQTWERLWHADAEQRTSLFCGYLAIAIACAMVATLLLWQ